MLTVVILTANEEQHLARAIGSVKDIAERVVVVDSGSVDKTREIARSLGAVVHENKWVNYATQFNWALDQLADDSEWVLRLDADEFVTPGLATEIKQALGGLSEDVEGVYVSRRMTFLQKPVRHGGVFPIRVLRLFRFGKGRCEDRWMDEHIKVDGQTADFKGDIIDDNLNPLTWWTDKHNSYASREVIDLLNLEYHFMPHDTVASLQGGRQVGVKRFLKEKVYARLPAGMRAFVYFFYRYVICLGFLDGREATAFHVLQGFWYRFLVDTKLLEVKTYMKNHDVDAVTAIDKVLFVKLKQTLDQSSKNGRP
ncbi:glycosyltransferase [Anderseniella sp. Alg231-50]|uniref:glycosyltransferase n=1 Tax=Anderseniella sp. Alg231-50 TaxID=1922226 RepID=UPI000D557E52